MAVAPNKRWFHPNIDGIEAKKLLLEKGLHGSFLVRFSAGEKDKPNPNLTLSVRRKNEVTNIKVRRHQDGFYDLFGGEPFASLSDLIQFYMRIEKELKEKSGEIIELRFPLNCEDPTSERWFWGKISGPASAQKLIVSKSGTFLVRESQKNPGTYCLSVKTEDTVTHVKIGKSSRGFDLGGGRSFSSLVELLEYYAANPIIDASQKVVHLKYPMLITTFPVEQIFTRIKELQKIKKEEGNNFQNGFWEEFNSIQQQEFTHLIKREEGMKPENQHKNCFKNIIPFDDTRVKLQAQPSSPPGSDYINANWIKNEDDRALMRRDSSEEKDFEVSGMEGNSENATKEYHRLYKLYSSNKQYIATQGCLKSTTGDFWQMIWQENVQLIAFMHQNIYATRITVNKFVRYWPELGKTETYGNFSVTTKVVKGDSESDFIFRELQVKKTGNDEEVKTVYHYHFNCWPEHGVPKQADRLLNFLYEVDKRYRLLSQVPLALLPSLTENLSSLNISENTNLEGVYQPPKASSSDHFPPIVVQCHSGIGRTGSLIVLDMIMDQIKRKGFDCEIDIHRIVRSVRNQRSGMIQTEAQYTFIYAALAHHMNTIKVRLDASYNAKDKEIGYTNIMLNGEYVRAYAFQPSAYIEEVEPSSPNSGKSGPQFKRVRFPSVISSAPEDSINHNSHISDIAPLDLPNRHEFHNETNSQRQRNASEQMNGASMGLDEARLKPKPSYARLSLQNQHISNT